MKAYFISVLHNLCLYNTRPDLTLYISSEILLHAVIESKSERNTYFICNQDMKPKVASKRVSLIDTLYNIKAKIYNVVYANTCTEYVRNESYSCAGYDLL